MLFCIVAFGLSSCAQCAEFESYAISFKRISKLKRSFVSVLLNSLV